MRRTVLLYRVVLGLLLLAPATAWGQTGGVAPPIPPPPPDLDGAMPGLFPAAGMSDAFPGAPSLLSGDWLEPASWMGESDPSRPAPPATTATTTNATGAANPNGLFNLNGPFGFFDPRLLAIYNVNYATTWFPNERVVGEPTHLGYLQDDFSLNLPLYHAGGDTWALSIRGRNETFSTQAVLPQGQRTFPTDLWSLNFGNTYAHQFDSGWTAGGTVNLGSASDQPFHSERELNIGANAFLRIPSGDRNAWMISLSYSPTAEVNFPIPMVAYIYFPSDYLRVNIGLPFQVMYRPTEDLTFNVSYMLLRTVHAQAMYRLSPWLRAHVGFDWGNESYFLADRVNANDRLFYYDKRASAGLLFLLAKNFTINLSGGYVFDRFYFEGAQYADKNGNELDIGAGPYISLQGRLRW